MVTRLQVASRVRGGAGNLKDRVSFDRRPNTSDGYGGITPGFEHQFTVAANISAKFGGEEVTAARLQSRQPHVITIRQSSRAREIATDWRARDARTGTVFAIKAIADPDGKRAWLELLCETGTEA